jgi:hypothetical protein
MTTEIRQDPDDSSDADVVGDLDDADDVDDVDVVIFDCTPDLTDTDIEDCVRTLKIYFEKWRLTTSITSGRVFMVVDKVGSSEVIGYVERATCTITCYSELAIDHDHLVMLSERLIARNKRNNRMIAKKRTHRPTSPQ